MKCPECASELEVIHAAGLDLDQCPSCYGIWFDPNELAPFIQFALENRSDIDVAEYDTAKSQFRVPGQGEPVFDCPVCASPMAKFNYAVDSNVILDRCDECQGLWVEHFEIRDLAEFAKGNPVQDKLIRARTGMAGSLNEAVQLKEHAQGLSRIGAYDDPFVLAWLVIKGLTGLFGGGRL